MPVARSDLMCEVSELRYSFDLRVGVLRTAANQSRSAGGLTALFIAIDPNVQMIEVFAGDKSDGLYKRGPNGWDFVSTR
jgi:hypothetical protein